MTPREAVQSWLQLTGGHKNVAEEMAVILAAFDRLDAALEVLRQVGFGQGKFAGQICRECFEANRHAPDCALAKVLSNLR